MRILQVRLVKFVNQRNLVNEVITVRIVKQSSDRSTVEGKDLDQVALSKLHEGMEEKFHLGLHFDQANDVELLPDGEDTLNKKQVSE